jgi:hypothetical protein
MVAHLPTAVLSLTTTASRPPGEDPGRSGTFWDVSTRCVQSVPLLGLAIRIVDVVAAHRSDLGLRAPENGGHSGRVNLIERSEILSGSAAVTFARQLSG